MEQHTDMRALSKKIKEMLKKDFETVAYEKELENYVAAAYDCGFDLDYIGVWEGKDQGLEKLWGIYKNELKNAVS